MAQEGQSPAMSTQAAFRLEMKGVPRGNAELSASLSRMARGIKVLREPCVLAWGRWSLLGCQGQRGRRVSLCKWGGQRTHALAGSGCFVGPRCLEESRKGCMRDEQMVGTERGHSRCQRQEACHATLGTPHGHCWRMFPGAAELSATAWPLQQQVR